MDAQIGQSGFEAAFEEYLHGVDGLRRDTVDKNGAIISQEYYEGKEPKAGNNVETTIDINLQIIAEDALADIIDWLKNPEDSKTDKNQEMVGRDVEGAAVVVMKVKTGEILACASYPTYNPQTYNEDYNEILEADFDPLFNRAFHATYAPGSSYKMVTMYAAMEIGGGQIGRLFEYGETIETLGKYRRYEDQGFAPACLRWNSQPGRTHGVIDAAKALEVSCNYFFYHLSDWYLSGATLDQAAKGFGLGEKTGIELDEAVGIRANAETKAQLYTGMLSSWGVGDKLNASIGQSENRFTPLQLCVYVATVANKGVRMKATFLNRVVASDYRTLVFENEPTVVSSLKMSNATYSTLVQGMKQVITGELGTARNTMTDLVVEVAAKTGTAETGRLGSDDGSFVCFAPVENPEIAIAVFGEKAAHGSTLGRVAKEIINYYFGQAQASSVQTYENQLS
jgi:penicillin-binding protein 2